MLLRVTRVAMSLQPKRHPEASAAWDNNDGNNSLDTLELFLDGVAGHAAPLFACKAQTVANLEGLDPGVHYDDTIAPGAFKIKAFVQQREFWCEPHGICDAQTLHPDVIGSDSITPTNTNRWLVHDWQFLRNSKDTNGNLIPQGTDTRVAWSAGCFVLPTPSLLQLNSILRQHGVVSDDMLDGLLVMA
jgi:hypothetical protein